MSYTPPVLAAPVVLAGDYTAPALSVPVVLCQPDVAPATLGTLAASLLPSPTPPLSASLAGESLSHGTPGVLAIALTLQTPALSPAFAGRIEQRGELSAALPPVSPSLSGQITGESIARPATGALDVVLPPQVPSLAPVLLGRVEHHATLVASMPGPWLPLAAQLTGLQTDRLLVALPPLSPPLALAAAGDQAQDCALVVALPISPPPLSMDGHGQGGRDAALAADLPLTATPDLIPLRVYGLQPYSPPSLAARIRLRIYYLPPPLWRPIITCRAKLPPEGYLLTDLPCPVFPLAPTIAGVQSDRLRVDLPLVSLADLAATASGDYIHRTALAATLTPPIITPPLGAAALGDYIHSVSAAIPMGPPPTRWLITRLRERPVPVTLAIALPPPVVTPAVAVAIAADQDLALPDADGMCCNPNQQADRLSTATPASAPSQQMLKCNRVAITPQQHGVKRFAELTAEHTDMIRFRSRQRSEEQHGILKPSQTHIQHHEAIRYRSRKSERHHSEAIPKQGRGHVRHQEALRMRHNRSRLNEQEALRIRIPSKTRHQEAIRDRRPQQYDHQQMIVPEPGFWWPPYIPPPLDLRFCCTGQAGYNAIAPPLSWPLVVKPLYGIWPYWYLLYPYCPLIPGPPPGGFTLIPVRRVYRVLNTVTLTRVSDGAEIPADSLSLSLSAEAWTWSWSARVSGSALPLIRVNDEPVELLATINGHGIRLRIDSISRARTFGSSLLDVRGRGRAAVLAAPTSPTLNFYNTEGRDAQQLLLDALTDNGVPIGWEVDWQIEDWPVTAGAWSHSGAYIDAATRIAEAGGGYVQGHDTAQTLRILPYYPVPPWEWAATTPDIQMPEDVCQTEGIEWVEKASYNAVFVTGARRDYIRRAGSDGLSIAPTIVDALATDPIMTRQRGLRALADTGKQAMIRVKLPVVSETGIIHPGKLIRYTEQGVTRLGLSRAVQVDCGFPEIWQTVTMESR